MHYDLKLKLKLKSARKTIHMRFREKFVICSHNLPFRVWLWGEEATNKSYESKKSYKNGKD